MKFIKSLNEAVTTKNISLLKSIVSNIQDEYEAINGYYKLLDIMNTSGFFSKEDIAQIEEIISDEKQHAQVLKGLQYKYDKIQTALD